MDTKIWNRVVDNKKVQCAHWRREPCVLREKHVKNVECDEKLSGAPVNRPVYRCTGYYHRQYIRRHRRRADASV